MKVDGGSDVFGAGQEVILSTGKGAKILIVLNDYVDQSGYIRKREMAGFK